MNALLGSFVVLATFVTLCNAQCYFIPNESSTSSGCKDLNGVTHQLKSDWNTDNCESCHCDDAGIHCCNTQRSHCGKKRCHKGHGDGYFVFCMHFEDGQFKSGVYSAAIPTDYDRDKCQAVLNKKTCTYTVLEKKNPLKTCTVKAWVL